MATPQAEAEPGAFALGSFNTALCLVPPEDSWAAVDSLRVLYDKAYGKWPPHVNMVYPFVQPEQLEGAVRRMQMALQQSAGEPVATTIDVQLDSTGVFQQRRENTVFLHDGREVNGLEKLRARLLAALGTSSQSQSQSQDKDDSHQLRGRR
ncbi:duf455 domain containing protein [Grosmannia clavigera kw1407]|uniref:Duf455 domain containing protein n=1 Tax=Grosmannia clavigera (strain kw1407 / UAMH 11150) TaxID=655863 RepID=F0XI50_GROCL|nr:duf455 domain containing protein [Grosmannia clavigera kw1407]EFX03119.1 duf455 domain containing protein [Grosmannia clavigera kw1407]